jgi:hypothetical protein
MAYLIFNNSNLVKIAENDAELKKVFEGNNISVLVNDLDFNSIKFQEKIAVYNNSAISYTSVLPQITSSYEMQNVINNTKKEIERWLTTNINHSDYNKWNNYLSQLNATQSSVVFTSLNSSNSWYGQIGSSGNTNDKKYCTKSEIDAAEARGEIVEKTNIINCSLEKYYYLNSQINLSLLQLPL